jgi:hypothetical protein
MMILKKTNHHRKILLKKNQKTKLKKQMLLKYYKIMIINIITDTTYQMSNIINKIINTNKIFHQSPSYLPKTNININIEQFFYKVIQAYQFTSSKVSNPYA